MKKYYRIICLAIVVLLMGNVSCSDFLDQTPPEKLNFDMVFKYKSTARQWLSDVYGYIPNELEERYMANANQGNKTAGIWNAASSETEYVWDFPGGQLLNTGAWTASDDRAKLWWKKYYAAIRASTTFLQNIDKVVDYTTADDLVTKQQFIGEARALRAIYYYYLMRLYGPVVLLGDDVIGLDQNDFSGYARAPFDECVEYVISELDAADANLKDFWPLGDNNKGRIDKSITGLFRTQVLMLAASPLFNGNTDYADLKNNDGTQLISQTASVAKWRRAADTIKNYLNRWADATDGDGTGQFRLYKNSGTFNPYLSSREKALGHVDNNPEMIFATPRGGNTRAYEVTPRHIGGPEAYRDGSGGLAVTQNMVDLYYMSNGLGIEEPASGYPVTNAGNSSSDFSTSDYRDAAGNLLAPSGTYVQWVNREPRFYADVTFNKQRWMNTSSGDFYTITEKDGNSGWYPGNNDYPKTGYIVRKYTRPNSRWDANGGWYAIQFRLAQVYLDYAEALNQCSPGHADILKYVNYIRERAGIPLLVGSFSQADMEKKIQRERRIELAFESKSYFDVRRWKIADETEGGPMRGLNIYEKAPKFYTLRVFESRIFLPKHYLFPIPQAEIDKCPTLKQNTGW